MLLLRKGPTLLLPSGFKTKWHTELVQLMSAMTKVLTQPYAASPCLKHQTQGGLMLFKKHVIVVFGMSAVLPAKLTREHMGRQQTRL